VGVLETGLIGEIKDINNSRVEVTYLDWDKNTNIKEIKIDREYKGLESPYKDLFSGDTVVSYKAIKKLRYVANVSKYVMDDSGVYIKQSYIDFSYYKVYKQIIDGKLDISEINNDKVLVGSIEYWKVGNNYWDVYFYTKKEAEELSKTLINCYNCFNCSNLVYCSNLVGCDDCTKCSYGFVLNSCTGCIDMEYCYNCKKSRRTQHSNDCEDVHDCTFCDGCTGCTNCIGLRNLEFKQDLLKEDVISID
jgi:hypothetical protein